MATGISRRIEQCFTHCMEQNYEGALVNLFPALDKTAKLRYPKDGVGERIRAFLRDEMSFITAISTGSKMHQVMYDDLTMEQAIYKYGRTSVMHEGELDPRLKVGPEGMFSFGAEGMMIPPKYVIGLAVAVVLAPENKTERMSRSFKIDILDTHCDINDHWGSPGVIKGYVDRWFGF